MDVMPISLDKNNFKKLFFVYLYVTWHHTVFRRIPYLHT